MRRYFLIFLGFLFWSNFSFGQAKLQPIKWTAQVKKINATTFDIVFTANIQTDWYLYSQHQESDAGPLPTTFIFQKNPSYHRVDAVKESWKNKIKEKDQVFDMVVTKYKTSAVFSQRVTATAPSEIIVMIEYMSCKSTSCLPERYVEFVIDLRKTEQNFQPRLFID